MLDDLENIPWEEIGFGFVPGLVRLIATGSASVCDGSLRDLEGTVFPQNTLTDATVHVVPFLVELAAMPTVHHRPRMLELLVQIAAGKRYYEPEETREIQNGFTSKFNTLLNIVFDTDDDVRLGAIRLVSNHEPFFPFDDEVIAAFTRAIETEQNLDALAALVWGLGKALKRQYPEDLPNERQNFLSLLTALRQWSHRSVHIAATCSLTRFADAPLVAELTPSLVQFMAHPDTREGLTTWPQDYDFGWGSGSTEKLAADAVWDLPTRQAAAIYLQGLAEMQTSVFSQANTLVNHLLDKVLAGKRIKYRTTSEFVGEQRIHIYEATEPFVLPPALSSLQLGALQAVLECDPFWEKDGGLLAIYGLPINRPELRQYIADQLNTCPDRPGKGAA